MYDLEGHVLNDTTTPKVADVQTEPAQPIQPIGTISATEVVMPEATEPEPIVEPKNEDMVIHSLFEEDDFTDEIDETPAPIEPAPAATPVTETFTFTPHEEEKPTVRTFPNPFSNDSDDDGFEITSRIMTHEEVTAKAMSEVAVLEAQKAKESDPKEELRRQRLRALSLNFRTQRGLEELESQPAYMRRDMDITASNVDDDLSRYTTSSKGISDENSFLHDNVD